MDGLTAVAAVTVGLVAIAGAVPAPGGAGPPAPVGGVPVADGVPVAGGVPVAEGESAAEAESAARTPDGDGTPAGNTATDGSTGRNVATRRSEPTGQSEQTGQYGPDEGNGTATPAGTGATAAAPDDPESDVLGWEAGYWHDEPVAVDQTDGLSAAELDALVARSMARVEHIRRLEFEREVPVRVVSRSALVGALGGSRVPQETRAWRNQVWEALFVVGEERDATAAFRNLTGAAVLGFYSPQRDRIVVVSDSADRPVVDNATLVHELVHALQDQHFDLGADRLNPPSHDAALAADGLVEGAAAYVEARYVRRCRRGTWNCVPALPENDPNVSVNRGLHAAIYQPYSDGPPFVASVVAREGWDGVNALYEDPPATTERVLHPDAGADPPTPLRFEDRGRNGWTISLGQGVDGTQTAGEATIYTMFWYQGDRFGIDAVPWRSFERPDRGPLDTYNYTAAASVGWAGDLLVPYRRGDEGGYVWKTAWDTERDARQFRRAYLRVLRGHGAEKWGPATWVVPDGPFADAFRVRRTGRTVTVVNGPSVAALEEIRPVVNGSASSPSNASSPDPPAGTPLP